MKIPARPKKGKTSTLAAQQATYNAALKLFSGKPRPAAKSRSTKQPTAPAPSPRPWHLWDDGFVYGHRDREPITIPLRSIKAITQHAIDQFRVAYLPQGATVPQWATVDANQLFISLGWHPCLEPCREAATAAGMPD